MKKRILYILLGVMLFSKVGVGQSLDLGGGALPAPSLNCERVFFTATFASAVYYEVWFSSSGNSGTYTSLGIQAIANSTPYYTASGYYYADFLDNSYSLIATTELTPKNILINKVTKGSINGSQVICEGGDPLIFGSVPGTGDGILKYRWESNTNIAVPNWSTIPSIISETYDIPSGLAINTQFRRFAISTLSGLACETISSTNILTVNVNPRPTATITNTNTTICEGANEIIYVNITAVGNWTMTVNDGGIVNGTGSGVQPFIRSPNITKNYSIVAASDANCSSNLSDLSGTWTITVNPTPSVNAITPQIKCNTISSDLINFSGTVTGTTYAWTNSLSSIGIAASGSGTISSTTLTNSTSSPIVGIFTVTPTANSCSGPSGTFTITVNPTPTVAAITPQIKCNTIASDVINFSGTITGTTYAWTNSQSSIGIAASGSGTISSTTLTNSTNSPVVGTFIVTPTANSCAGPSGTFTITVNPTPTVAAITPQIKCNTIASDVINFSGTITGTTYAWTNSQSSIGIAASGSGTISSTTLTNSTNSPVVGTFIVTPTANSCAGPAGTFSITVNSTPAKPTLTSQAICEGATATITGPTGTYTYTWAVPTGVATSTTNTINTTKAGNYSLTITDANSCTSEVGTATVTVNPLPTKPTLTSQSICEGATATISGPTGTYTYTWTVPTGVATSTTNTINTSKAGTYSLTITDANSCISEVGTATVTVNPLPAKPTLTSQTICEGVTATITGPSGTYTYTWQVPNGVATSTTKSVITSKAGTYSLTITDANSCISEVGTATVTLNALPPKPTLTSPVICEGANATVTMSSPTGTNTYTYTWQVPTGVATSTTKSVSTSKAGTYSLTITDENSCTSEVGTGIVTVNALPTVTITNPSAVCVPSTVDLTATAITAGSTSSLTYTYFTNATATTSLTNANTISTTGTYYIKGTTASNCSAINAVIISINAVPTFNVISPSVCVGSPLKVTVNPLTGVTSDYDYTWIVPTGVTNPGNVPSFTTTTAGVYTATIKNKTTNCTSAPVNNSVSFYPLPIAAAIVAPDNKVIVNNTLNLTASASGGSSPYNFTWSPNSTINYTISGQENALFTALKEGKVKFKYQVKDANNCEVSSAEYEITIDPADIILVLPNAFTPNGDNNNDEFKVVASNTLGKTSFKSLEIYNRNGKLMFRTEDITKGWNGRSGDVLQDMGVYFAKLVKLNKDGQLVVETSPIYLLK